MKTTAISKISFTGLLFVIAIIVGANTVQAITWGEVDENDTYSNVCMVGISVRIYDSIVPQTICSGTLIHQKVVLTAGHCIEYVKSLEAFLGKENVLVEVMFDYDLAEAGPGTGVPIKKHFIHPNYFWGPVSNPHDVGLLTFEVPFASITPAALPTEGFLGDLKTNKILNVKSKFAVVGYGCTVDWPPPVVNLMDSFIRRYAESEYRALLPAWLTLSQNKATGNSGTCFGDSGGPVFWIDSEGNKTLVGVTSWGDPNCVSPSFNYRVDIADTLDFIEDVIDNLE